MMIGSEIRGKEGEKKEKMKREEEKGLEILIHKRTQYETYLFQAYFSLS